MNGLDELRRLIDASSNIVFFGGAGVSTESGIPDFRSADGLYSGEHEYPPETILSHSFFTQHPEEFYRFYRKNMVFLDAEPNAAHRKLAAWEAEGKLSAVITQNIDGLHQKAGSRNVLELHGSVHRNYCVLCGAEYGIGSVLEATGVPRCGCGGAIRPDVVLYQEALDHGTLSAAAESISSADLLMVGGTSLSVYPAAGLLRYYSGKALVLINRSATPMDAAAAVSIRGSIAETLGSL